MISLQLHQGFFAPRIVIHAGIARMLIDRRGNSPEENRPAADPAYDQKNLTNRQVLKLDNGIEMA
jgi:hypothetical protein